MPTTNWWKNRQKVCYIKWIKGAEKYILKSIMFYDNLGPFSNLFFTPDLYCSFLFFLLALFCYKKIQYQYILFNIQWILLICLSFKRELFFSDFFYVVPVYITDKHAIEINILRTRREHFRFSLQCFFFQLRRASQKTNWKHMENNKIIRTNSISSSMYWICKWVFSTRKHSYLIYFDRIFLP